jgi:hypothetical protein
LQDDTIGREMRRDESSFWVQDVTIGIGMSDDSSFWAQDDKGLGIKALSCERAAKLH